MKRKVITTADGSKTIHIEDWNEQYHSKHGAINEALHVFIDAGLKHFYKLHDQSEISILEIGFGTGLNAFLTAIEAKKMALKVNYVGVEAFPVSDIEIKALNYPELVGKSFEAIFKDIHATPWEKPNIISENFTLTKRKQFFKNIQDNECYDLIYFDAFGARVQPELWTKQIFKIMYKALKPNGVLVTYAAIGKVKRAMLELGFAVERLPGPPGKRHMLRATV